MSTAAPQDPTAAVAAPEVSATDAAPAGTDGQDYLDKGIEAVQKSLGGKLGDPNKTRGAIEKITDKLRGMFEKATGKKVPAKLSN